MVQRILKVVWAAWVFAEEGKLDIDLATEEQPSFAARKVGHVEL